MPLSLLLAATLAAAPADTAPIRCDNCEEWNLPHAPFRLFGNSYYVGVDGLSSVLVVGKNGMILIDGALPQSAPRIAANIRALGFRVEDVRWIVNSHTHFDHAGGIAALARMSGAQVAASPRAAEALRAGRATADDPQAAPDTSLPFPAVAVAKELQDEVPLVLGDLALTPHFTPGHTPGGTTWTWTSCEAGACRNMVYADSLTPVSAEHFRFSDDPMRVAGFRHSIALVRDLPCDLLVSAHPGFSDLFEKQAARAGASGVDPLLAPGACRAYADASAQRLDARLAEEAASAAAK